MMLTKEQIAQLEEAARPLIKYLNENYDPYMSVIVTQTSVELVATKAHIPNIIDYVKD